jgi:hypothetical protein
MDRYTMGVPAQSGKPSTFELASFADVRAAGTVHIGELKAGDVRARDVKLVMKR